MDFSKSLSFGENTFREIDDCEAKVKVFDENQLLLTSNAADSENENIEKFKRKSTDSVKRTGMQHKVPEDSLTQEKSIMSKRADVLHFCYGREKPSKHSPVVGILHETIGLSKR